jgi:hypothetical protein
MCQGLVHENVIVSRVVVGAYFGKDLIDCIIQCIV